MMVADYRVQTRPAAGGGQTLTVSVLTRPDSRWDVLTEWSTAAPTGGSPRASAPPGRYELGRELAAHGWTLTGDPIGKGGSSTASVAPANWRRLLDEATQTRRAAAEHATRVERAWQTLIGDTPRTEVPITEIAEIVGLTRGRVHNIRREQDIGNKI